MTKRYLCFLVAFAFIAPVKLFAGVSTTKLESALVNLRDDHKKWNCRDAYRFLVQHKEESGVIEFLRDKLGTEEDIQARGAMISVLCLSRAYDHDADFATAVLSYLGMYATEKRDLDEDSYSEKYLNFYRTSHFVDMDCAKFLIRNAKKYEQLLAAHFYNGPIMSRWVIMHALARNGLLDKYKDNADDEFYRFLFTNLKDDNESFNALYASRILVILGEHSLSFIQQNLLKQKIDSQEKKICRAILDGVSKPRNYALFHYNVGDLYSDIWDWEEDDFHFQYELPKLAALARIDTSAFEEEQMSDSQ